MKQTIFLTAVFFIMLGILNTTSTNAKELSAGSSLESHLGSFTREVRQINEVSLVAYIYVKQEVF